MNFTKGSPGPYARQNNKSFQNNEEFGISEIRKLVENKAVVEVDKQEVICINRLDHLVCSSVRQDGEVQD